MMKLLTFDKTKYEELVSNIEDSNGYVCYINSKVNEGVSNAAYYGYLVQKQEMYTKYTITSKSEEDKIDATFIINDQSQEELDGKGVSKEIIDQLYQKYGVDDDYIINILEEVHQEDFRFKVYDIIPIEKEIYNLTHDVDNTIEKINRYDLSENFVFNEYKRFMLIPPIIKNSDGEYEVCIVVATIYCTGIITLQTIVTFTSQQLLPISEVSPRDMRISEANFHKIKEKYSTKDFWIKDKKNDLYFDQIVLYFESLLLEIGKIKLESNPKNTAFFWTMGDFQLNKNSMDVGKSDELLKMLNYYLLNSRKSIIDDMTKEYLYNTLKSSLTFERKSFLFYCSKTNAVLYFKKNKFVSLITATLKEEEKALKEAKQYDSIVLEKCKKMTILNMFNFIRFYELAFIKKYYIRNLIDNIANSKYQSLTEYQKVKNDLNFLNIRFDEEFLFPFEGSARELYKSILVNTETDILQTKAEFLIKSFSDDISKERESKIKQNEISIVIFSSIITIVLGYNGIKIIVNDILCNIPLFGYYINLHPLRWSIIIWLILVYTMVVFNIRRLRRNR